MHKHCFRLRSYGLAVFVLFTFFDAVAIHAQVALNLVAPVSVSTCDSVVFTNTFQNLGSTLDGLIITNQLPAGSVYVTGQTTITLPGGQILSGVSADPTTNRGGANLVWDFSSLTTDGGVSHLLISEVFYDPVGSVNEESNEWVEIYNPSLSSVSLSGYTLGDALPGQYDALPSATVAPGQFVIIAASTSAFYLAHAGYTGLVIGVSDETLGSSLNNFGDGVFLKDGSAALVDGVSYGGSSAAFTSALGLVCSLIGLQVFAMIWFYIQQSVFINKPWEKYLKTLPLSQHQNALNEIGIMLLMNFAIWIPLFLTAVLQIQSHLTHLLLLASKVICCIILVVQTQIICKQQRFFLLISIAASDVIWFYSSFSQIQFLQLPLLLSLITINGIITLLLFEMNPVKIQTRTQHQTSIRVLPLLRVQIGNLIKTRLSTVLIPFFNLTTLLLLLNYLASHLNTRAPFLTWMFSGLLLAAVICSGFFKKLHRQREQYSLFLQPLPITPNQWIHQDCLLVSTIWFVFSVCFFAVITRYHFLTMANALAMLVIGQSYLLLCYIPQTRYPRYGTLICLILLGLFSTLHNLINWN